MPIYNEDVARVFSPAFAPSRTCARVPDFDFFVLSDSTNPANWVAEELAWQSAANASWEGSRASITAIVPATSGARAATSPTSARTGAQHYHYMVVLDADSLMTGATLIALVRLMDANPRAALIQAAPALVGGESLFARIQQFATGVYGPLFPAGLAYCRGPTATTGATTPSSACSRSWSIAACRSLPGRAAVRRRDPQPRLRRGGADAPRRLGGLARDDLERQLRGVAADADRTLKRDRRWCQGNLQHIRLLFARGLSLPSRLHLAMGVMGYLSSPLWLISIALFTAHAVEMEYAAPVTYYGQIPGAGLADLAHGGLRQPGGCRHGHAVRTEIPGRRRSAARPPRGEGPTAAHCASLPARSPKACCRPCWRRSTCWRTAGSWPTS